MHPLCEFKALDCGAALKTDEPKNAAELPVGRFQKSVSLGRNRVILVVRRQEVSPWRGCI
jgi:hypothetical protein